MKTILWWIFHTSHILLLHWNNSLGRAGVDVNIRHEGESACAVTNIQFLVNEGALVTSTADDTLHLWNFRQKSPLVVQSLKFQRERWVFFKQKQIWGYNYTKHFDELLINHLFSICRITCLHLPVASKWLYVGTEKGNIHVVHIETFALSGYIINWNKAIEV